MNVLRSKPRLVATEMGGLWCIRTSTKSGLGLAGPWSILYFRSYKRCAEAIEYAMRGDTVDQYKFAMQIKREGNK